MKLTVKGFYMMRLNPNNQCSNKANALSYFQEERVSDQCPLCISHACIGCIHLISIPSPTANLPLFFQAYKKKMLSISTDLL